MRTILIRLLAVSVPSVEDVFEEIGGYPEYLIAFQLSLPRNTEAIQYHLEDILFQRKDLDICSIATLYSEFIQQFINSWFIVATDASKSPFIITFIEGCKATSQFSYRVHTVNSIFTAEALALTNCVFLTVPLSSLLTVYWFSRASICYHQVSQGYSVAIQQAPEDSIVSVSDLDLLGSGHRGISLNEQANRLGKMCQID